MSDPMLGILRGQIDLERRIGQTEVKEVPVSGVYVRYKTATAQSFATGATNIVNYDTLDTDPLAAVTTGAAWKFTAPFGGQYCVNAAVLFSGTTGWADTEAGVLSLHLNNNATAITFLDRKDSYGSASSVLMMLHGQTTIQLATGDYIDVRAAQTSGGSLTLLNNNAFNYIDIWKL